MKPVNNNNMLSKSNKEKYRLLGNKIRRINTEKISKPVLNNNIRKRIYSEARLSMGPKYNMSVPKRPYFNEIIKRIKEMTNAMKTFVYIERVFYNQPVYFMIKSFRPEEVQSLQGKILYELSKILEINSYNILDQYELLMRIMNYNNKSKTKKRVVNSLWDEFLSKLNTREIHLLKELSIKSEDYAQEWKIQFHPDILNPNSKFIQEQLESQIYNNMRLLNDKYKKRVKQNIEKINS